MKEIKKNGARIMVFTTFFLFLALYMTQASGYNEYQQAKRTALTEEEIAIFEQDLKEGKEIKTKEYFKNHEKSYDNRLSKMGFFVSKEIEKVFQKGMNAFFKMLEDMAKTEE